MKGLRSLFDFNLNASIHVALAVVSLYVVTVFELNKTLNFYTMGFLFFGTIVCYNFMKYGVEAEKYLIVHKSYPKIIQAFSFLCFPFAMYCFYKLDRELWFPIALLALISGLYILPFLPSSKNLRSLGGFKIYLVALVWVGCTVVLPILENQIVIGREESVLLLRRFILIIILFIPFEIKDLRVDEPELKTLPQRIGIKKTKLLGYILVLIYGFLLFFSKVDSVLFAPVIIILLFLAVFNTKLNQSKYYASFWVEAIPMVLLLISYLFTTEI